MDELGFDSVVPAAGGPALADDPAAAAGVARDAAAPEDCERASPRHAAPSSLVLAAACFAATARAGCGAAAPEESEQDMKSLEFPASDLGAAARGDYGASAPEESELAPTRGDATSGPKLAAADFAVAATAGSTAATPEESEQEDMLLELSMIHVSSLASTRACSGSGFSSETNGSCPRMSPRRSDESSTRGVPMAKLLKSGTQLLRDRRSSNDSFELSKPRDSVRFFVSHAWHSNGRDKYLTLLLTFNGKRALVAMHAIAFLTCMAQFALRFGAGVELPVLFEFPMPTVPGQGLRGSGLCLGAGVLAGALGLFFGHRLWGHGDVFLDKCCIHQTDEELRKLGIQGIHQVLEESSHLLVLWDEDVFERLWCAFELAAFVHYKGRLAAENIAIVPISSGAFSIGMFLLTAGGIVLSNCIFALARHLRLADAYDWKQYLLMHTAVATIFCWLPKYLLGRACAASRRRMDAQLQEFALHKAKISSEEDRATIEKMIKEWFSSLEHFDALVSGAAHDAAHADEENPTQRSSALGKLGLRSVVQQGLGNNLLVVPYSALLLENCPAFFLFAYDGAAGAASCASALAALLVGFGLHLVLNPLLTFALLRLTQLYDGSPEGRARPPGSRGAWGPGARRLLQLLLAPMLGLLFPLYVLLACSIPLWIIFATLPMAILAIQIYRPRR